jgi:hypothetical protein
MMEVQHFIENLLRGSTSVKEAKKTYRQWFWGQKKQ